MEGWTEVPVGGSVEDPKSRVYSRTQTVGSNSIRSVVTHTVSITHKSENVITEVQIKKVSDGDDKYLDVARCVTIGAGDNGYWLFLNGLGDKYQVFGGAAGREGVKFAKPSEKFVLITPKDMGNGKDYWVVMLISDESGVYRVYDKADCLKYDSVKK